MAPPVDVMADAGMLDSDAPDPENVVAVAVPEMVALEPFSAVADTVPTARVPAMDPDAAVIAPESETDARERADGMSALTRTR